MNSMDFLTLFPDIDLFLHKWLLATACKYFHFKGSNVVLTIKKGN